MFSPDLQMLDLNPVQWRHLYDLFWRRPEHQLVLIHENRHVLKAYDTDRGLRPDLKSSLLDDPVALATRLHRTEQVDQVWILDRAALDTYYAEMHTVYQPALDGDEYFQLTRLALDDNPGLVRYPPRPRGMALAGIPYATLVDLVARVPDGETLILGVFDAAAIWMSVIALVVNRQVRLITTSDALLPIDVTVSDWRATAREMLDAAAARIGRPYAALFCERTAWLDWVACDDKLGRLKALESSGNILLHLPDSTRRPE